MAVHRRMSIANNCCPCRYINKILVFNKVLVLINKVNALSALMPPFLFETSFLIKVCICQSYRFCVTFFIF